MHQQPSDYAPPHHPHPHPHQRGLHQHQHQHSQSQSQSQSQNQPMLPSFAHATNQYELVKLEDEPYQSQPANCHNGYASTLHQYAGSQTTMGDWHGYSAAR